MEKAILRIPIKRHCRKAIVAAPFGRSTEPVVLRPGFNTDYFYNGQAVEVSHHNGEVRKGIIGESRLDYMSIFVVDKLGLAKKIELELEDYINGVWLLKLL